jgi:hypothetical protein
VVYLAINSWGVASEDFERGSFSQISRIFMVNFKDVSQKGSLAYPDRLTTRMNSLSLSLRLGHRHHPDYPICEQSGPPNFTGILTYFLHFYFTGMFWDFSCDPTSNQSKCLQAERVVSMVITRGYLTTCDHVNSDGSQSVRAMQSY